MSGFFGVASKKDCVEDLFYGTDYHSHLGTRRAGMATYGKGGFHRAIHNIENSPFRTKFESDVGEMEGNLGIGCISDYEPQPLLINSRLGNFAIATVGRINNMRKLLNTAYAERNGHFQIMSNGKVNATELTAALICGKDTIVEGIRYAQDVIDGSMSMLVMTDDAIYAARDRLGRTPVILGRNADGFCAAFEDFAFTSLGYGLCRELGPAEIVRITPEEAETVSEPGKELRICSFLWVYYGYPTSSYEGVNVEEMRYRCGSALARHDRGDIELDMVAGVPDSGTAHAIGYANESGVPYTRPFIKYTPTWSRSFMPTDQETRNLVAKRKLIPVPGLIRGKRLLLIDDSIVRGTQLRETTEFLYNSGAKEVHVRPACPPIIYGCRFLNFSRSRSDLDLIARQVIDETEGDHAGDVLEEYADPDTDRYAAMVRKIAARQNFTTLRYHRLDDLVGSIGIDPCCLCTYCFNGKE